MDYQNLSTRKRIEYLEMVRGSREALIPSAFSILDIITYLFYNGHIIVDKNKPEQGKITVSFEEKGKEFFRLKVKDDGRGINPGVIRKAALKLGIKGEQEIMSLKDEDLIQLIFDQGVSSKEKVTNISGRGVGMDAIKTEAEKVGGKVWVESQVDVGTTFIADLPLVIKSKKSS